VVLNFNATVEIVKLRTTFKRNKTRSWRKFVLLL